jgi:uncharacterized protein
MLKFLLLALVILWLCYSPGVRKLLKGVRSGDTAKPAAPPEAAPPRPTNMVPCTHCGVHLPQGDALFNDAGEPFCSEAHRRARARDR